MAWNSSSRMVPSGREIPNSPESRRRWRKLAIAGLPDKAAEWTQGHTRFQFRDGDLKSWDAITNAEVVAMTRWVESRLPVIGVDAKQHIVSFSKRSVFELEKGDLYYAEGAFEFLDEPGEWYLDPAVHWPWKPSR